MADCFEVEWSLRGHYLFLVQGCGEVDVTTKQVSVEKISNTSCYQDHFRQIKIKYLIGAFTHKLVYFFRKMTEIVVSVYLAQGCQEIGGFQGVKPRIFFIFKNIINKINKLLLANKLKNTQT